MSARFILMAVHSRCMWQAFRVRAVVTIHDRKAALDSGAAATALLNQAYHGFSGLLPATRYTT